MKNGPAGILSGIFIGALCLFIATSVRAATYYVSPSGSDNAAGTMAQPFASLQKGNNVAMAGDTVFLRGGTYSITTPNTTGAGISITKSGTSDSKRIYFWAYPGEVPILDFSKMTISATSYTHGLSVTGSWLHFKGIEERGVPMNTSSNNGVMVDGASHDIFEQMNMHNNCGNGIFIGNGTGGHLILNCDAHDNYDPGSTKGAGQNADGFGVHYQKTGDTTILRGCRSWWNSDDGFDCINQSIAVKVENCWNWLSGYVPGTMTPAASGNGNGFKVGGWGMPPTKYPAVIPQHVVHNCMAFLCKAAGFYQNHQLAPSYFYNNTSYNNRGGDFNMLGYDLTTGAGTGMGIYRNNVAYLGTATTNETGADASYNSWDITGLTVAATDFLSVDTTGVYGPRKADGSLPDIKFMHLAAGSKLIDKGTKVGFPFNGAAPDLGAFEYGATSIAQSQTAFAPAATPRTRSQLNMEGFSGKGAANAGTALFTITGQRITGVGSALNGNRLSPGVYIEKRSLESGR
jgi:hypothetical protein